MSRVLVIDDDRSLRDVVSFILEEAGHEVLTAENGAVGILLHDAERPDVVLTDFKMPVKDGLDVLRHVMASGESAVPVIVLSAYGTVEQAVEAMKLGAFNYILKPFNRDELRLTVEQALRSGALARENAGLRTLLRRSTARPSLVYASDAMKQLIDRIAVAAATDASVLITGESGVGKELVARALHDLSPRWDCPFVAVNCGAIPADLMESELFGHARGAFTGADRAVDGRIRKADRGTLLLDEIGELPLSLQPKLLRVLETKTFEAVGDARTVASDFRLISATNCDLLADAEQGLFREDLYYRIGIVPLHVPPLRDRLDDISVLWDHFCELHAGAPMNTAPEVIERLKTMPWRGNVRELKNVNQRAVMVATEENLDLRALDEALAMDRRPPRARGMNTGLNLDEGGVLSGPLPEGGLSLVELEKQVVSLALKRFRGNKTKAAAYLGVPRHVLIYRIQKYGLES